MTPEATSFYKGFAVAVGALAREHDKPSIAKDIMNCNGVTMAMLKEAGADEFDLKILAREFKSTARRHMGTGREGQ